MLTHSQPTVLLGSCFSDNIGARMRSALMNVDVNAFGPIYNPLSLATSIQRAISGTPLEGNEVFFAGGMWNSFLFHTKMSRSNKLRALEAMNNRIAACHQHLTEARALIVTLGSAMVYRHRASGCVVSNCHKLPGHEFVRSMESIEAMTEALAHAFNLLFEANSLINIIITVSPIRHVADGMTQNSLSKAKLRVVADNLATMFPGKVTYFPSYEIVMDDLRDYRFYAPDMVHPSEVAVEYIWQAFQATFFDDRTSQAVSRCERVSKRLAHRHITDNPEAIARFDADTRTVVTNLVKEYPYLANNPTIKSALLI